MKAQPDLGRWRRVRQLFERAAELEGAERRRFLEGECPEPLRAEVEALLEADERTDPRWERTLSARRTAAVEPWPSPAPAPPARPGVGDAVGPYRLVEEIGRGGMGRVLRAVRDDGLFRREVAVKLARGPVDEELRRRFLREVRVLAALEHPRIARMYDGGATADGDLYVVMELIRGLPIDRYCEEQDPPLIERVRLMAEVCRAVDHAHRRLVVHRDLKPANVLVTAEGEPVLLDFGIAKLLDEVTPEGGAGESPERGVGESGSSPMTLDYASPEQLRGEPVTTASDVYSLGVVLYRLVAGRLPAAPLDPPSRSAGRRELGRGAAEDLDRVVAKALAEDPEQRYPSALGLAEDLDRVLAGRPVAARPSGGLYRARRFLSRHRIAAAIAAALAVLLLASLAGLAVSGVQARRERDEAQAERRRAERLAGLLEEIFETASPETLPASELSAGRILAEATARLEAGLADGEPQTRADLYAALGRIRMRLGEFAESERLFREAVRLRRASGGPVPALASDLTDLADAVRENGSFGAAAEIHRQALELRRAHYAEGSLELTESLDPLAAVQVVAGHHEEAREAAREALAIRRAHLGPDHPEVGDTLATLGNLALAREDHRTAVEIFRRTIEIGVGDETIDLPVLKKNLAVALLRLGEVDEAEPLLREILAEEHRLYGDEHPRIAFSLSHLGEVMRARGRPLEAESYIRRALEMRRSLLGSDHPAVGISLAKLADLLAEQGREAEALASYRRAVELIRGSLGPASPYLANALVGLGRLLLAGGDPAAAEPPLEEALAIRRRAAPPERVAETERALARCRRALSPAHAAESRTASR